MDDDPSPRFLETFENHEVLESPVDDHGMIYCTQIIDVHDFSPTNQPIGLGCSHNGSRIGAVTRHIAGYSESLKRLHTPIGPENDAEAGCAALHRFHLDERWRTCRTTSGSMHLVHAPNSANGGTSPMEISATTGVCDSIRRSGPLCDVQA